MAIAVLGDDRPTYLLPTVADGGTFSEHCL